MRPGKRVRQACPLQEVERFAHVACAYGEGVPVLLRDDSHLGAGCIVRRGICVVASIEDPGQRGVRLTPTAVCMLLPGSARAETSTRWLGAANRSFRLGKSVIPPATNIGSGNPRIACRASAMEVGRK